MCIVQDAVAPIDVKQSDPIRTRKAQLIYELLQMGDDEVADLSGAISKQYIRSYRQAYNDMLKRAGSRQRLLFIPRRDVKDKFARTARQDAHKIRETYNKDLWRAINRTLEETPNFTRDDVISRLRGWNIQRQKWKAPQVALWADRTAVQEAQADFVKQNANALQAVVAELHPKTAVCDDCQRLIQMGEVSAQVAEANPCPVHVNCVHQWKYRFKVVGRLPILRNLGLRFGQAA